MKKVVILGAGGFAQEVFSFLEYSGQYKVAGFIDSKLSKKRVLINGVPVLGDDNILGDLLKEDVRYAFVAIGNSESRGHLFKKICDIGFEPINVIHPSAIIAPDVAIGRGIVIYPNVTINTHVSIGDSVLINSNVSIGHDVKIGNFTNINPGVNIAGRVTIRDLSFLGIGCSVLENIVIGSKVIVGGGALVCKDVTDELTIVGVPAKPVRKK